jgi:PAS domain-containing protein
MLFDPAFVGTSVWDAVSSLENVLQSSTGYALISTDPDGKIPLWNEGARRLFGYEAGELLGKATLDLLFPSDGVAAGRPVELPGPLTADQKLIAYLLLKGLELGAARFLCRPLEPHVFPAEIKVCLREGRGRQAEGG